MLLRIINHLVTCREHYNISPQNTAIYYVDNFPFHPLKERSRTPPMYPSSHIFVKNATSGVPLIRRPNTKNLTRSILDTIPVGTTT